MTKVMLLFCTGRLCSLALLRACIVPVGATWLILGLTGCKGLVQSGSSSFASVTIKHRSSDEIQGVAAQVFRENGYSARVPDAGKIYFEKEGSRANSLAYNGVVGTHYGAQTLVRVKAEIVELDSGGHRLQCQAYMVRNPGDSFFEDETRLSNLRSGPYQNLLEEIAKRLK